MKSTDTNIRRRSMMIAGVRLLVAFPIMLAANPARAMKASKDSFKYQDYPKEGKSCANCSAFRPQRECSIIDGEINPQGWCIAYSAGKR